MRAVWKGAFFMIGLIKKEIPMNRQRGPAGSQLPLDDDLASSVYDALAEQTQIVTFTDPYNKTNLVRKMRLTSNLEATFIVKSVNGKRYYKGGELQMRPN